MATSVANRPRFLGLAAASALCIGAAEAAGSTEVFDLWTELESFEYTVMLTVVIVGLVLFDLVVESYEHYLHHHKGRFHQSLFKKVRSHRDFCWGAILTPLVSQPALSVWENLAVKELMILGLISFVLFLIKDQRLIDLSDDVMTNTFDFVNFFLFFVGVSFVIAAVLIVMATSPLKARWDTYANVPLERLLQLHEEMIAHGWKWYLAWPPRYFIALRQAQVLEYHLFRSVFLRLNRSLLTPAFDFSKYSGAIVNELILVYYDVGWASWLLAVVALFFTIPITTADDGSEAVSAHGAIVFGLALVVLELLVCGYTHYAHRKVTARMGAVDGFKGVGKVLEELWVEPQHHFGQETSAIDVKDLLLAAPVNASGVGASTAELNFKAGRSSSLRTSAASTRRANGGSASNSTHGIVDSGGRGGGGGGAPAATSSSSTMCHSSSGGSLNLLPPAQPPSASSTAADNNTTGTGISGGEPTEMTKVQPPTAAAASSSSSPASCPDNGANCAVCGACDPLYLPPGRVQNCSMGGDSFVLAVLRPPSSVVGHLPGLLKGFGVKVGGYWWFQTLLGMSTLLKCYYSAFYFSYALGRATEADTLNIVLWTVLVPLPLLLCLLPLAKRTVPLFAQMACLQGQIVWELVSDIEEKQEIAARAREAVLAKLQETLRDKMGKYEVDGRSDGTGGAGARASSLSRAMDDLFGEWDTDGDNNITKDELSRGLANLGVYLSSIQLRELFRLADPDHSKSIDPVEFRAFLSDLQTVENEPEHLSRKLTMLLERRSIAEELLSGVPRVDDCKLFSACAAARRGEGQQDGASHRGSRMPSGAGSVTSGAV